MNISHGFQQYKSFRTVAPGMWVCPALCFLSVFDYFWNEEKMLTTWD